MSKKASKKPSRKAKPAMSPTIYMDHDDKNYYLQVELPGVKKENVSLEVSDQSFCVKGPRTDIDIYGCYILAHAVDGEKAKAKFEDGLLNVEIPIKKILKGKKVAIE